MAANIEILGVNTTEIPFSDKLKQFQTVNIDAQIIVKDLLHDIFDTAVGKAEDSHKKKLTEKNYTETSDANTGDLIDLTRNYKQEFKTILQNLKCQTHKTQPTNNTTLEEQIQRVIDEIKSLETSVRLNIEEGRGDITMNKKNKEIKLKTEVVDFLNPPDKIITDDDDVTDEEVVLQVINLQEDSEISSFNAFPSEEDLEDVSLTDEVNFNQGDRPKSAVTSPRLLTTLPSAGETAVQNPVPDPEPETKLLKPEAGERKKKSLGKRIWRFIRKGSGTNSCQKN